MEKLHLPIIIEMDENDYYIVSCPLFKGCHSYGETIDEALENIREVIEMCLEELNKFVGFREMLKLPVIKGRELVKCLELSDKRFSCKVEITRETLHATSHPL